MTLNDIQPKRREAARRVAACAHRRQAFLRYALPLFVLDFLAPVFTTFLPRSPALILIVASLTLFPLPILLVLTLRLLRAACPWCDRPFFLRTQSSHAPVGRYLVFSTLLEKELRCSNCGVMLESV